MSDSQGKTLTLVVCPVRLAVCRLPAGSPLPAFVEQSRFQSITRTMQELSIVCEMDCIPPDVQSVGPWACLEVEGPLDFSLTGILASLTEPLASTGISVFAISTYDTDYLLVREGDLTDAVSALRDAGHRVFPVEK